MKKLKPHSLRLSACMLAVIGQTLLFNMNTPADTMTNATPPDPALDAKKREADLAEAELRLQNALKSIAQAKKDAEAKSILALSRALAQNPLQIVHGGLAASVVVLDVVDVNG